jgi:hypothetical protein
MKTRVAAPTDDIIIPVSRAKVALAAAGALAFALVGLQFLSEPKDDVSTLLAGIGVAFFGGTLVYLLARIVKPRPAVVISSRGITDTASALGVGFLAWEEIAEMRVYQQGRQTFLGIMPKDVDALLDRLPAWQRWVVRDNLASGAAPINIPQVVLPISAVDLLRKINLRRPVAELARPGEM